MTCENPRFTVYKSRQICWSVPLFSPWGESRTEVPTKWSVSKPPLAFAMARKGFDRRPDPALTFWLNIRLFGSIIPGMMILAKKPRHNSAKAEPYPSGDDNALYHCEKQRFLWKHTRETFVFAQQERVSESPVTLANTFEMPVGGVPSPMYDTDRIARLFKDYQIFMRTMMKISLGK